jgi:hypothetical protein
MNIIGFEQKEQTCVVGLVWYLQSFYWVDGSCQFLTFFLFVFIMNIFVSLSYFTFIFSFAVDFYIIVDYFLYIFFYLSSPKSNISCLF